MTAGDAILGLGSNVGDKAGNIEAAIRLLTEASEIRLVARSKLYRTAPWGVTDQDWFANACIKVRTTLSPRQLLDACQHVEKEMGRVRQRHWGPRNIDVDILTYSDLELREPDLVIPHPRIAERAFVLVPLRDVAPETTIGGVSIGEALAKLDSSDVMPIND